MYGAPAGVVREGAAETLFLMSGNWVTAAAEVRVRCIGFILQCQTCCAYHFCDEIVTAGISVYRASSFGRAMHGLKRFLFVCRYWAMYKLPMFGCTDASQVLGEIANATKSFPDSYVRLAAFDAVRQVQTVAILVHRPPSASDFRAPENRSR